MLALGTIPQLALFDGIDGYASVHTVMEAFSFAVCALIFGSGWYAGDGDRSGMMGFLSAAFLAVGLLDLGHVLTFGSMPAFFGKSSGDKTIFFWLAARYIGAIALLVIALSRPHWHISELQRFAFLFAALAIVAAIYWIAIGRPDLLPSLYVEGRGLTAAKIWAEYLVVAIHVLTAILLVLRGPRVAILSVAPLLAAVIVLALSELAFTLYNTGYDNYNVIGHVYKVIGFALIFRVVFVAAVTEPYRKSVESERLYRQLSDGAPDAIFMLARDGTILSANPSVERLTGRTQGEVHGVPIASLIAPYQSTTFVERLTTARQGGTSPMLADFVRNNGTIANAEISVSWLDQERCLAIARDVTERLRSEAELRLSREHLALAQRIGQIGSVEVDVELQKTRWSDELFAILGLNPATAPPTFETHLAATHPDDRAKLIDARNRVRAGEDIGPVELRMVRPNGEIGGCFADRNWWLAKAWKNGRWSRRSKTSPTTSGSPRRSNTARACCAK